MSQVVVNLCINANEAMPNGGALNISSANVALDDAGARLRGVPAGDYLELTVRDSGSGMTDDVRIRVFEPFFTTKVGGQVRGTGLGLSTVYGIVQSHNGSITVESAPGAGTSFAVCLPKGLMTPEQTEAPRAVAGGTGVILVADDEDVVRRLLVAAIEKLGYRALAAVDGEDAVRVFRDHRHEITGVLLDLKMPRKDGAAAFREIREIDPAAAVVICSGYGDNEEAQNLITLGAKGLLAKPFSLSELAVHLSKLTS